MRNLIESLTPRHIVVLALAGLLVLGGVTAAFANRDDVQPALPCVRRNPSRRRHRRATTSMTTTPMAIRA